MAIDRDPFDDAWDTEQAFAGAELSTDHDAVCDLVRVIKDVLGESFDDPSTCSPEVQTRLRQLGAVARLLGVAIEDGEVARVQPEDYKALGVRRTRAAR